MTEKLFTNMAALVYFSQEGEQPHRDFSEGAKAVYELVREDVPEDAWGLTALKEYGLTMNEVQMLSDAHLGCQTLEEHPEDEAWKRLSALIHSDAHVEILTLAGDLH